MALDDQAPSIPIVDFGQYLHGSEQAQKAAAAAAIDSAFQNVGFVYLTNHAVPQEEVDKCFEWGKKFFDLPLETKNLAPHPPGGSHHRGYSGLGLEKSFKISRNGVDAEAIEALKDVPDVKESFESGNINDETQPNIWLPEDKLPGFRAFMESFFTHLATLIHSILNSLSLALSLPESHLSATHAQSLFQLRLLHYPPVPLSLLTSTRKPRIHAHSDFGTLTLLFQDSVGGLEIKSPPDSSHFIPAKPIPGAVLVNVGDLMERWSNGRWRSTVHRVVAPPIDPDKGGGDDEICKARYSIPFFATADPETVIEALPGCWGEGRPKKYESVTAWGYVQMRMAELYS